MSLPEGTRAELVDGELYMSPSPFEKHQRAAGNLYFALRKFVDSRMLGRIYAAPFDVHLPSGDIVQPDLIFIATRNFSIIQKWIYGAPDLLVEIASPPDQKRDQILKRDLYARNGVAEYWIVDPEAKAIEVLTLAKSRYEPHGHFEEADTLLSPLLTGLSLPVRLLFE